MSKNREESTNYYLYIDGQAVPVSEQVYRVYQHYERKEEYFSYDLKTEKFQKDTAIFLPSREDSYERLLEKDKQFAASGQPEEQQAVSSERLEEVLPSHSEEETNRRSRPFGWRNYYNICHRMRGSFSTNCISRTSQNGLSAWSLEFPKQLCISVKSSCSKN